MKLFEVIAKNYICMLTIVIVCGLPTKLTGTEYLLWVELLCFGSSILSKLKL